MGKRKRVVQPALAPAPVYEPYSSEQQAPHKTISRQHKGNSAGDPLGPVRGSRQPASHPVPIADDDGDGLPFAQEEEPSEQQQHSESRPDKARAREDLNWRKAMHSKRKDLLRLSPQYAAWHAEECAQHQDKLQKRIDSSYMHHTAHCLCQQPPKARART